MSEAVACLVRVGDNIRKNRLIKLDREQITVGRSGDVNYTILSTMISRCHAIFKQQDGKWTITDNKSLNGVYVNGRQLTAFKACTMEDGDMVQLGVPTSPDTPAEFLYKYHASLKVRIKKDGAKRLRGDSQKSEIGLSQDGSDDEEVRKRKEPVPSCSRVSENPEKASGDSSSNVSAKEAEYQARLAHMEKLLQEKELKQSEVEKQLEKEKEEREKRMKEVEELRLNEQAILLEMQDKQAKLEKEKEELKQQMQAELEANLKEKEQALISQLADQKQSLLEEKKRIEESLQEEMAKALEVKNKEVEERLISMKENLEKVIEKKDNDQKLLETRLNETKEENESAKLQAIKAREDVLSDFVDLMEMELQCTICNELFIKATALNCAHVFCKLCISQWMKVKKECPNCRMPITSHMQAIALDSYIEKMVEQLSDELKDNRKTLLDQRKVEQDKFDAGPSAATPRPVPGLPFAVADTRGRGRNARGGRNTRGGRGRNARGRGATAANAYQARTQVTAVTITQATSTTTGANTTTAIYAETNRGRNVRGRFTATNTTALHGAGPYTRGATAVPFPFALNVRGGHVAGRNATTATVVSLTNPVIMAVATPPTPSTATHALRSMLGITSSTTSTSNVVSSTTGLGQTSASATSLSSTSTVTPIVTNATSTASIVSPIVVDGAPTVSINTEATPIVVGDGPVTSERTPIEVSDGDRTNSDDEDEETDEEALMYERFHRRRRYWMDSDSENDDNEGVDSDDEGNSNDAVIDGVPSRYYGGYGRCYKCGCRGHWANGCPF